MSIGRGDIIGDLARLRNDFLGAADNADDLLGELEILAAAAFKLAMSHAIVGKVSGILGTRIDAVVDARPTRVSRKASGYERHPTGVISQRSD